MSDCPYTGELPNSVADKPRAVDFWERHEKTARLARLTQAAAVLYSNPGFRGRGDENLAIYLAFKLEELVIKKLKEENETRH